MTKQWPFLAWFLFLVSGTAVYPQAPILPPGEKDPLLRLEAEGPTSYVTALAFSPDGQTLYAAGWDKVVRVWTRNAGGKFALDRAAYRVPLGPGLAGAINALALSPDGTWLAAAGQGVFRGSAGFREPGLVLPSIGGLSPEMLKDQGTIYVFNTRTQTVRLLRGHQGPVLSLAFAHQGQGQPPVLVSAAQEWNAESNQWVGVVRLWDVERGKYRDRLSDLPGRGLVRPGLAAWSSAPQGHLRVAIAWYDDAQGIDKGVLRLWDVGPENKNRLWKEPDLKNNITVAYLPGLGKIVTAAYGHQRAQLGVWKVPPGAGPQPETKPSIPKDEVDSFPRALALFAAAADGELDHAAVVVQPPTADGWCRLQVFGLKAGRPGDLKAEFPLWKGRTKQPVLATAPRGRFLAVAGNDDHQILIYPIKDLLDQHGDPQVLGGVGTTMHFVAFGVKGKDLGLILNERGKKTPGQPPRDSAPGDLVLDFANRSLTQDRDGWKTAFPPAGDWRAVHASDKGWPVFSVYEGKRLVRQIELPEKSLVTDFALLPPQPPFQKPILAIAYHEQGQPTLCLYDVTSGERIRQYTGHLDPIHCVAFSPDGRLLVSASEDQTVCVWSLTNLDKVLGRLGQIRGLAVREPEGKLVVARIQSDSPARGKLREGEVIEGLVEGNQLRALTSERAFYETMAREKIGKTVTLRVREPQGHRDVPIVVGQGVDERKPLFSLFITRPNRAKEREWIGWNPIGPYESSSPKADRYIGWHFNTGQAEAPTRFAFADQYRKQYYREGLLQNLLAQGNLTRVPPLPPLPPPKIGLLLEDAKQYAEPDGQHQFPVRHPQVTLHAMIMERRLDTLEGVTWKLDDGAEQKFDLKQADGQRLSVALNLTRGIHRVVVAARTPEVQDRPYVEEMALRYQPPPPRVEYKGARTNQVDDPNFTFRGSVHPGLAEEPVTVRFLHNQKEIAEATRTYTIDPKKPAAIQQSIKLQPGYNLVEVVAANQKALRGYEPLETDRLALEITLVVKAPPPAIVLEGVLPEGVAKDQIMKVEPGAVVRVHTAKIRILGKIKAAENLSKAEWTTDRKDPGRKLAGFESGKVKELEINEAADLKPGPQTFHFLTRTATSDEAERSMVVDYQPPLPTLKVQTPKPGTVFQGDQEAYPLRFEALLQLPEARDRHPYQLEIQVNGQGKVLLQDRDLAVLPFADKQSQRLNAQVPVPPGDNRIQVRLSNRWGGTALLPDDIQVRYQRPPRIVELKGPAESRQPFVDLVARVRSPLPLLRERVDVEVNGIKRPVEVELAAAPAEAGTWTVQLKKVPLDAGAPESRISVRMSNREAPGLEPGTATVTYRPLAPPPVLEFLHPRGDVPVDSRTLKVRVQIRSPASLKDVRLIVEKKTIPVAPSQLQAKGDGLYEAAVDVPLAPGFNHLRVEASNEGGQAHSALVVNYLYQPVRLVIDRLVLRDPSAKPIPAEVQPGGRITFPELPHGRVRLEGHLLWDREDDERLQQTKIVRVYVNGFQQLPAELKASPKESRRMDFGVNLLLNQFTGNEVKIAVPELVGDAANRTEFLVDCHQPERAQRLYLVIVSRDKAEGERLRDQFRKELVPLSGSPEEGSPTGLDPSDIYLQAEYYSRSQFVLAALAQIKNKIWERTRPGVSGNDVVVFYYQGRESITKEGHFFRTGTIPGDSAGDYSAITRDQLINLFADTPGAHLLFLDVACDTPASVPRPRGQWDWVDRFADLYPDLRNHAGVLRYAWLSTDCQECPKEARLNMALNQALAGAAKLIELRERISEFASKFGKGEDVLEFQDYISRDLEKMELGSKR
jgi:WD40 repeat protein